MLPIQSYFTTDIIYYPPKAYSARSLVKAYWKKDYSELDCLPKIQLESTTPRQKFKESLMDISGTFGSLSRRQIDTERKIMYKLKTMNTTQNQERHKTPKKGKIIKGYMLKDNQLFKDQVTHYKEGISLQQKLLSKRKISKISFNPTQIKSDINIKLKIPLISKPCDILNHVKLPANETVEQPIFLCECSELYSKPLHQNANILVIYFDGLLGFDEHSFFGENQDFIDSSYFHEYRQVRGQQFSKCGSLYYLKHLTEICKIISKDFSIIFLTSRYTIGLLQLVKDHKLNVHGIYQHNCREQSCLINFKQIINSNHPSRIYFLQPISRQINLFFNRSSMYLFRVFYFPQISMYSLMSRQSIHEHSLSLRFIAALNSEIEFNKFLAHYKFSKCDISCDQNLTLKYAVKQQESLYMDSPKAHKSKKQMIRDIQSKFQWSSKIETLIIDLVQRNKKIRKGIQTTRIGTNHFDFTAEREKEEYQQDMIKYTFILFI